MSPSPKTEEEELEGLTFVDELPGKPPSGRTKTLRRAEIIKASTGPDHPNRWAKWPSKTGVGAIRKALGQEFEVEGRDGHAFIRWLGDKSPKVGDVVRTDGITVPPEGAKLRQAQCFYCKTILGECVDPEELVAFHREQKPVCDRKYRRDGQ